MLYVAADGAVKRNSLSGAPLPPHEPVSAFALPVVVPICGDAMLLMIVAAGHAGPLMCRL